MCAVVRVAVANHRFILYSCGIMTLLKGRLPLMAKVCARVDVRGVMLILCDADIREFTPTSWRSIIGVVPQVPNQLQLQYRWVLTSFL